MEEEKFKSKRKCATLVLLEMILSFMSMWGCALLMYFASDKEEFEKREYEAMENIYNFNNFKVGIQSLEGVMVIYNSIHGIRLMAAFFILIKGGKVLADACSLLPYVRDRDRLDSGANACRAFCRLEILRMTLFLADILVSILGRVGFMNYFGMGTIFYFLLKLAIPLGWFYTREFRKELIHLREKVSPFVEPDCPNNQFNFLTVLDMDPSSNSEHHDHDRDQRNTSVEIVRETRI